MKVTRFAAKHRIRIMQEANTRRVATARKLKLFATVYFVDSDNTPGTLNGMAY